MAKKIILFKADATFEDKVAAKANGMVIRNPHAVSSSDFVEQCDAVCGDVPEAYSGVERFELEQPEQPEQPKAPKAPKQPKAPSED